MQETDMSASTEWLKRAAFLDELNNKLLLLPAELVDEDTLTVIHYFKSRVAEITKSFD
jgi:hypothetical protein